MKEIFSECLPAYLTKHGQFRFEKLLITGIDNSQVLKINAPVMADEEICLVHRNIACGDNYLKMLQDSIILAVTEHRGLPVVRFADGEYAFYRNTLDCNGLYQQTESLVASRDAMPAHIKALKNTAQKGILAPLIFPGNARPAPKGFLSFLKRNKGNDTAAAFLQFLYENGIELTGRNYTPFYAVYAYLTSWDFARFADGKKICILNSDYNPASFRSWFNRFSSRPEIVFTPIPPSYVATRWETMRDQILEKIPSDIDLCLVGAGVGALLVCVDAAEKFSIPAIDAGHVLNMMNELEVKSHGPRLYTLWKEN